MTLLKSVILLKIYNVTHRKKINDNTHAKIINDISSEKVIHEQFLYPKFRDKLSDELK